MTSSIDRPPEVLASMQRTGEAVQQLERDAFAVACWLDAEFPGLVLRLYRGGLARGRWIVAGLS